MEAAAASRREDGRVSNTDRTAPTPQEWLTQIGKDLDAGGFTWRWFEGFPLVERPRLHQDGIRLLKFRTTYGCEKRIYAEGMLFVPPGFGAQIRKLRAEAGR